MATQIPPLQQQQSISEGEKPGLRKPVFTKVDQLKPGTIGHTLTVKVLSSTPVLQKGRSVSHRIRQTRIAECVVGDETGTIVFTARNDQGIMQSLSLFYYICVCAQNCVCLILLREMRV